MKRICPFIFIFLHLLFGTSSAQEEFEEETLFRFEEYVVTAARRLQRIEEAPAAVTVVTAEDIRHSGLNNIPDILRVVAGVDVVTFTAFDTQVNVRGFSEVIANKLLVLIDGRSVYQDFFGCTFWETLPVQLEDIKRIEVVKGPGSVMYGANAFSGVVNIITKSPEESKGGLVSATGGQFNHYIGSLIYAGKLKDFGYKVTGGWEETSQFADRNGDSEKIARGTTQLTYQIDDNSLATLDAGISDGKGEPFIYFPGVLADFQESHIKANYNYSDFRAQTFLKHGKFEVASALWGVEELELEDIRVNFYTYDLELQHSIELGKINSLMGGFNYRFFTLSSNYTDDKGLNTYAGYLQYEIKPISSIILNLGVRIDHQDYIGTNYSPRGCLLFTPLMGHTLRLSVGRAFRNPTYIDLFADVSALYMELIPFKVIGNEDLDPEGIISYDLGYQAALFDRVRAKLDFFFYKINNFVDTFGYQKLEEKAYVVKSKSVGEAKGIGGEAGLDYLITSWLSGLINYSYQEITDPRIREPNPRNKLNLGLRATLTNRISANLLVHYVGATKKRYLISLLPPPEDILSGPQFIEAKLDPYVLLNASISYRILDNRVEFTVSGQNLLDYKNYKDKLYNDPGTDPIPLTVFGSLRVKF